MLGSRDWPDNAPRHADNGICVGNGKSGWGLDEGEGCDWSPEVEERNEKGMMEESSRTIGFEQHGLE